MRKMFKFLQVFVLVLLWSGAMAQAPYCTPTYTTGCTFGDGLTNFQLGTINQAIPCSGTPYAWYHDYTASTTTLTIGTPATVTVIAGYSSTYVDMWIDYNNNNVFDQPGEIVVNDLICTNVGTPYTAQITVPAGTPTGNHRLRFRTNWLSAVTDPCVTYTYGNSADFTVNVTGGGGPPPPPPPATITVGTGTSSCSWPYLTYWMDGRTQLLYTGAQIAAAGGSPGLISQMGFDVISRSTQAMNGFTIRMQNSTLTTLPTTWTTTGWTDVYVGTYTVHGTGWQLITLQNPFIYDGTSLMIEICYDNNYYTSYSYVRGTPATNQVRYYYFDGSST